VQILRESGYYLALEQGAARGSGLWRAHCALTSVISEVEALRLLTSVISSVEALRLICKKCVVAGRVQGVFYRATAARRAQELAVRGYARNLADGRVEVLACGEEDAVRTFVSWLWTGSTACKVTSVDVVDVAPDSVQVTASFQTS
jgi:acylphosphatase